MEPLVEVQHCLLIRRGMPDPGTPRYNLFGVGYRYEVAADTEFPTDAKPPWAVYLRVVGRNAGPTRVLFRVHYRNPQRRWQETFRLRSGHPIPFSATEAETHDVVLNLPYLRLGGVGLHAITGHFCPVGEEPGEEDWRPDDAREEPEWETEPEELFGLSGWQFGAVEYFWIARLP